MSGWVDANRAWLLDVFTVVNVILLVYVVVLQTVYTLLTVIGWRSVNDYVRRRPLRDYGYVASSELSMPVTILVPAHNEQETIAASVDSLLRSQYSELAIVVINDGSTDATLAVLQEHFHLVRTDRVPRGGLPHAPLRGVYVSTTDPRVLVLDKENGGKADALNLGLNHARYPLVCAVDADTMLDTGALARLVWEFQARPETVAVGGIVRVLNGSVLVDGRLVDVRTPSGLFTRRGLLANLQIVEYLRAFLGGRIGWSRLDMLLIISGAFGLFRRDALVAAGGYDASCVGEDAELVLRLHRMAGDTGQPARITFFPDPICWTEAPSRWRVLVRQRDRWQRGLAQLLWRHRAMMLRRRYGRVGIVGLPYYWVFELFGPTVEVIGYTTLLIGTLLGIVNVSFALLLLGLSIGYGVALTLLVILMEQRAFRRYPTWVDLRRMVLAAVLENFGYRQFLALVRMRAWWTLSRGHHWGTMTRTGFGSPPATGHAGQPAGPPAAALAGAPGESDDAR